jgi:hypothetical protein
MKQIIIIFEFQQGNIYKMAPFKDMIRKYGAYAFITNNSCIIWTNATVVNVRDNLMTGLGSGDKLYVGETKSPAAWTNTIGKEVSDYVIKNLK